MSGTSRRLRATARVLTALALLVPSVCGATMPTRSGDIPDVVRGAFEAGLLSLPERPPGAASQAASSQTVWRIPVILVNFSDASMTYGPGDFETPLFDTTGAIASGSMAEYYLWASEGRLRVKGEVVAVVNLPGTREWYAAFAHGLNFSGTPNNTYGMVFDALQLTSGDIDWEPYDGDRDGYVDMLWVIHPGPGGETSGARNDLWSVTSRLSGGWRFGSAYITTQVIPGTGSLRYRVDRFSCLPELSGIRPGQRAEIGVFCHEFGHALGLPDLYDTSAPGGLGSNVGPGNWSLMSTGAYGGNGVSPESPSHPGGWASTFLGWRTPLAVSEDTTLALAALTSGGDVFSLWFQGPSGSEHFLVEHRRREGSDRTLNYEGLLVTHLDEALIGARIASNRVNAGPQPALVLVEADGDGDLLAGRNRGDAYDPFPGLGHRTAIDDATIPNTRSFSGAVTNVGLHDIRAEDAIASFRALVRAQGWSAGSALSGAAADLFEAGGAGPDMAVDRAGGLHLVKSQRVAGRPQVVLRSRIAGRWTEPLALSSSPVAALSPAIVALPGEGLAVAWSDQRDGRSRIFYRARIAGVWSEEAVVGDLPGDNITPTLGVDAGGRIHLAWVDMVSDVPTLYFSRFLYFAPFGQAVRVTPANELPALPALAVEPGGRSYLVWTDWGASPARLQFARFHPDTGVSTTAPLTPAPSGTQNAFAVFVGPDGALHTVWAAVATSARQLHYQRRPLATKPAPRDTVIEETSTFVTNMTLAADPSGTLHLTYESAPSGPTQVYYKRWRPGAGWDLLSTEITRAAEGSASRPALAVYSPGNVVVVYSAYPGGLGHLFEHVRTLDGPITTEAPVSGGPLPTALAANPNPLRAGATLRFSLGAETAADRVELFDLAGRRVAAVALETRGSLKVGALEGGESARLTDGVYFARVAGLPGPARRVVVLR